MMILKRHANEGFAVNGPCIVRVAKVGDTVTTLAVETVDDVRIARLETLAEDLGREPTLVDAQQLKRRERVDA